MAKAGFSPDSIYGRWVSARMNPKRATVFQSRFTARWFGWRPGDVVAEGFATFEDALHYATTGEKR